MSHTKHKKHIAKVLNNYLFFYFPVCGSMDIRNKPSYLSKLRGCRVIEGFLQILLMDGFEEKDFMAWRFPELVEVTEYILLYRVNGLTTLRNLFPNLAVIRGEGDGFFGYALVVYEMLQMQVSNHEVFL